MRCPACNEENLDIRKFCRRCGAPLAVAAACPKCGASNESGAAYCGDCGVPLASLAATGSAAREAPAPPHPTSFVDGRYEVRRFLGEGGKKRVYLAHDSKLDRDVAFALIKTDGLDAEGQARIRREAQAMGRLGDHPHVVSVFDIGEEPPVGGGGWGLGVGSTSPGSSTPKTQSLTPGGEPTGVPYIVSQLMAGGDVEGLIERAEGHRLPLEEALRIADQVCRALEHAHGHGVVHRDLKPGNVWLTEHGTAKLGDFGLAVALDRSRLTQAGKEGRAEHVAIHQGGRQLQREGHPSMNVREQLQIGRSPSQGSRPWTSTPAETL